MAVPVRLETRRLRLRQWRPEDRAPFAALNADPEVMAFFPAPLPRAQSDAMADRCEALIAERGWGFWAAETRQDASFVGFVGLHTPIAEFPFSPCTEIGWRLARPHRGRGYATEAALEALRFGFSTPGLAEIVSFAAIANVRSRAAMERLGMVAAPAAFEHPALPGGHRLREHCLYRLSRERWSDIALRGAPVNASTR